jgi:hypothetical protein
MKLKNSLQALLWTFCGILYRIRFFISSILDDRQKRYATGLLILWLIIYIAMNSIKSRKHPIVIPNVHQHRHDKGIPHGLLITQAPAPFN